MRNFNHGFCWRHCIFVTFAEATRIIQPCKSSLHYPTRTYYLPTVRRDFLRDFYFQTQVFFNLSDKCFSITAVGTKFFYRRINEKCTQIPIFVSCWFALWVTTANKQPILSVTICRLIPNFFFLHRNRLVRLQRRFERFENRRERQSDFLQVLHFFVSALPYAVPKSAQSRTTIETVKAGGKSWGNCRHLQPESTR